MVLVVRITGARSGRDGAVANGRPRPIPSLAMAGARIAAGVAKDVTGVTDGTAVKSGGRDMTAARDRDIPDVGLSPWRRVAAGC